VYCGLILNKYRGLLGLGGGSPEDSQNDAPVCGTSPQLRKRGGGDGGDPHRLQKGAAEGWK
jgi:hypothetical protein